MSILNQAYFDKVLERLTNIKDCTQLQELIDDVLNPVTNQIAGFQSQISKFAVLITPPTDLTGVINWITAVIGIFPQTKAIQKQIELVQKLVTLQQQIQTKLDNLQCNITLPPPPTL